MSTNTTITALQAAVRAEATCYTLPYGGLGFASHLVTYYTLAMFVLGRRPLAPFRPLTHTLWSGTLGGTQLFITAILSIVAMRRCRTQWAYVSLGVEMLVIAICLCVMTIASGRVFSSDARRNGGISAVDRWCGKGAGDKQLHGQLQMVGEMETNVAQRAASMMTRSKFSTRFHGEEDPEPGFLLEMGETSGKRRSIQICCLLVALWLCGCVVGVVGMSEISTPQYAVFRPLYVETIVFGALLFLGLCFMVIKYVFFSSLDGLPNRFWLGLMPVLVCAFAVLWVDWTLGVATGNVAGMPEESTKVLYWTYIVVERLGLLAM